MSFLYNTSLRIFYKSDGRGRYLSGGVEGWEKGMRHEGVLVHLIAALGISSPLMLMVEEMSY